MMPSIESTAEFKNTGTLLWVSISPALLWDDRATVSLIGHREFEEGNKGEVYGWLIDFVGLEAGEEG